MAELFDWRTIVSRRMVFGVGRYTENRLVNNRVSTTFYCFGVELPLFLWSVFVGMTGVMGHDFGIEVARRVARDGEGEGEGDEEERERVWPGS